MPATAGSPTFDLARFVAELQYGTLPSTVRERARAVLLDTLAVMLAAAPGRRDSGRRLYAALAARQPAEATLVGHHARLPAEDAALVNGASAYFWDFDAIHLEAVVHGPAAVLPAALALAEARSRSGSELLAALIVGVEVACRASLAIGPKALYRRGFQPSAICGALGAAAAAGRLLGLDPPRQAIAFGLAATQAGGLLAWSSDPTEHSKSLNTGLAARAGVSAALLAEQGFGGPPRILDPEAEYQVFRAWADEPQPEQLTTGLGERFSLLELAFKLYPCCAFLHPALDAIELLRSSGRPALDDIAEIRLRMARTPAPIVDASALKTHCAQTVLAAALVKGRFSLAELEAPTPTEPAVAGLAAKVRVVPDDDCERDYPALYTSVVEIEQTDGRTLCQRVERARGHPDNPLSFGAIAAKARDLAGPVIGERRAARLVEVANQADRLERLDDLAALLAPSG